MSLLKSLKNAGVKYATNFLEKRSIVITNIVALTLVSLGLSLSVIYLLLFGITPTFLGILSISVAGLLTIALNFRGQINIGKTHLALFVPIFATVLSVYAKIHGKDPSATLDYFNYRIIILGTCTFPWLLFSLSERKILIANASLNLFILMMYDPIHTWFGIPYKNASFTDTDYIFFNVVFLITYLMTSVSLLVMKSILEKSEQTTFRLVHKLNMANVALKTKNTAFEHQTSTLISKSEALEISQKNLLEAYEVIQEQKKQLISQNEDLTGALLQKNKDLTKANNELIKHNHELRQFSYTVSHNLRGPVASLLGLIELFRWETLTEENSNVAKHIRSSGKLLDSVIKDLTKIIDIRNDIFQIRQKINIHQEVELVLETLNKKENHSSTIRYHLDTPDFYSVKPMIHSILYNLVSNAMKYRSSERESIIDISTSEDNSYYYLSVKDNGLGINIAQHQQNLFKLYKRFHFHTEGKGIGLYLVKLQSEALGGSVEISSEINRYTLFTVKIKKPKNIERQLLFQNERVDVFYDGRLNSLILVWHEGVTGNEYREVYFKCLEFIRVYNTPNFIADMRLQGVVDQVEQEWFLKEMIPQTKPNGIHKIATILPGGVLDGRMESYLKQMKTNFEKINIDHQFFLTFESAIDWVQSENEKAALKIRNSNGNIA